MLRSVCALLLAIVTSTAIVGAQCGTQWRSGFGIPGVNGTVYAMISWDPDGAGPLPARLVVAGRIDYAGVEFVNGIGVYDPAARTWSSLGLPGFGSNFTWYALAVLPTGDLVAAGDFPEVRRWTGTTWVGLGGSHFGTVRALRVRSNGDLVAGGEFASIGGTTASNVASWNGSAWTALGAGVSGGTYPDRGVHSLAELSGGDLAVGGYFTLAGTAATEGIARWNGTAWSTFGAGVGGGTYGSFVRTMLPLAGGSLLAAGTFTTAGTIAANNIALWNGAVWVPFGSANGHVYSLFATPGGVLYAGGSFTGEFATWTGSAWAGVPGWTGGSPIAMAELPGGDLAIGGSLTAPFRGMVRWNHTSFSAPSTGVHGPFEFVQMLGVAARAGGGSFVGGMFDNIDGVAVTNLASWNGTTWAPVGTGVNGPVSALATTSSGDLIVGGSFSSAGGTAALSIARWNGSAWSAIGAGVDAAVDALVALPNGDILAGGLFTNAGGAPAQHIARWNGSAWSPLGSGVNGTVAALAVLANGDVVAGGTFTVAGGVPVTGLARWNGSAWSSIGTLSATAPFTAQVAALRVLANGDLAVGGLFASAGGQSAHNVASWDGTSWHALGNGMPDFVTALLQLPNGDLLVAGSNQLWRWNGVAWTDLQAHKLIRSLAMLANGDIQVAGEIPAVSTSFQGFNAILASTCPADATAYGSGCNATAGAMSLAATSLPWLGATFRSQSTGFGPNAFGIWGVGSSQLSIPVSSLIASGGVGCTVLASFDIASDLVLPTGSTAAGNAGVPVTPSLIGLAFYNQMAQVELDPTTLAIVYVATSNGLALTVGSF